ncbi:molybdopterin cofactor-binding domain-containing protein [Granulicella sibirica]|uniref:molybdopterin cofactor-binding domain-containing protein n=1 Tax=Granulicella sibirica TaxID=2479048 RepID=UPI001009147C
MRPFVYERATDVASAVAVVSGDPGAQFLAGGTSQVDLLKEHVQRPTKLVDISRLPLSGIVTAPGGGLRIGANVKNATASDHPLLSGTYPGVAEALHSGASQQIRNMASMAGNLLQRTRCPYLRDTAQACNKRDPGSGCAAVKGYNRIHAIFGQNDQGATSANTCIATHPSDLAVALAAHDAVIVLEGGDGRREIAFEDLYRLPYHRPELDSNLLQGDMIIRIDLPAFRGHSHYLKVRDRASYAYGLVTCAVALDMDRGRVVAGRIALGGVALKPWRAREAEKLLAGAEPNRQLFHEVAAKALEGSHTYAMNKYKPGLGRALVERALLEATGLERLQGKAGTVFAASVGGIAGVRGAKKAQATVSKTSSPPADRRTTMDGAPIFREVGRDIPRADGRKKVTGTATYAAEWNVQGLAYGSVVDSTIACGTILSIYTADALAAPGVIAVVTHENAPRLAAYPQQGGGFQLTGDGGLGEARQPLQDATVYYGAQSIAVVIAETSEQARYGATLVRVTYDEKVPELDMDHARRMPFPPLFAGAEKMQKGGEEVKAAIEAAPISLTREYETPVYHHNPIELLASIAVWNETDGADTLTLYDATRSVDMLRGVIAQSFGLPESNVRVVSKFIGGAFGSKAWSFHNPMLVALAARVAKRPVRIEWRRQQVFSIGGHRPALHQTVSIGADGKGRLKALQHDSQTHTSQVCGYTEFGGRMTKMMYDVPQLGFSNRLSYLNLPSPAVMRGPGFLMGGWALESALDELACELGMDPVELRLANYAETDPDTGLPFSNKHLRECYERGRKLFGWEARASRTGTKRVGNDFVGYGFSTCMHPASRVPASARATIFSDGRALVCSATHELGNGTYTIFAQIAADGLRLPVDHVQFDLGDTDFPTAPPTHGSLTTASVGPAVFEAARNAVEALKAVSARTAGSPLFGIAASAIDANNGRLSIRGQPEIGDSYAEALRRAGLPHISAGSDAAPGDETKKFAFYSFGAVFAEVRVDAQTGVVRVARLCGVYDCGRLMNPRTAHSQLMGGMIFGLGQTLMEETVFDPVSGMPVVRNLADYHVPSCGDTPEITVEVLGIPDPYISQLGAHGVGEMGCNGVPPAITNAIFNATGKRLRSLPVTPDKILGAS